MNPSLPIVLVPALFCTPLMYAGQIPALWQFGPVMVADHRRHNTMTEIARHILDHAPKQFALVGASMGGYIAFEIMRQAPERVLKLALIVTSARADTSEQIKARQKQMALANAGEYSNLAEAVMPLLLYRHHDVEFRNTLIQMARETGVDAFVRQQQAVIGRVDSRPLLPNIRCPTLVLTGTNDKLIPPDRSREIANGIAGARYREIPNCGHAASTEQPEPVTQALVEWLQ